MEGAPGQHRGGQSIVLVFKVKPRWYHRYRGKRALSPLMGQWLQFTHKQDYASQEEAGKGQRAKCRGQTNNPAPRPNTHQAPHSSTMTVSQSAPHLTGYQPKAQERTNAARPPVDQPQRQRSGSRQGSKQQARGKKAEAGVSTAGRVTDSAPTTSWSHNLADTWEEVDTCPYQVIRDQCPNQ